MATLKEFCITDLIITLGPVIVDGEGADGELITIAYDGDAVTEHEGIHGDMTVLITKSKKGTATLRVGQASTINDKLSAFANAQRANGSLARFPFTARHTKGTFHAEATGYIRKEPDAAYGDSHQVREWAIGLHGLTMFVGGSVR